MNAHYIPRHVASLPLLFFDAATSRSTRNKAQADRSHRQPNRRYCCAVCKAYVTDDALAAHIQQQHVHRRRNPLGQSFTFGCFHAAPGCRAGGDASDEHSWFHGHRWRFAHCAACHTQLGWHFSGEGDFFALILEQMIECSDNGGP